MKIYECRLLQPHSQKKHISRNERNYQQKQQQQKKKTIQSKKNQRDSEGQETFAFIYRTGFRQLSNFLYFSFLVSLINY